MIFVQSDTPAAIRRIIFIPYKPNREALLGVPEPAECASIETKSIVRYGCLKAMYIWTILISSGFGAGLLLFPDTISATVGYPG